MRTAAASLSVLSIATNACAGDARRLGTTVPSWLRTFGSRVREIIVVVDPRPASGRIAVLHGDSGEQLSSLQAGIGALSARDSRVRSFVLDEGRDLELTSRRWFRAGTPLRCQAGTPIFAFLRAIDAADPRDTVMRLDCDMLLHEAGWLASAQRLLDDDEADLIEPARLSFAGAAGDSAISTRVLLLRPSSFSARLLPMRAHRLDRMRRVHRRIQGRPSWLALEQMFDCERQAGRLRHRILEQSSGFSLHVGQRDQMALPWIERVVEAVESGAVPQSQRLAGQNFDPAAWSQEEPA